MYSTYSALSTTPLLELYSAVVQEILPDRSSVEEIEGKSPMLKIKTCFRWKHPQPSGVLRMEVALFSGFELTGAPPYLIDPMENMAEMEHGYNANNLWFVFANVSYACPVCVQYLARSVYVISSLRPAYAKIYPANREDLAAEAFFHTQIGSPLLQGITEDDLITWFGKNSTNNSEILNECITKQVTTTPAQSEITETTETTTLPTDIVKITTSQGAIKEDLSVTTYTINVDNNSIRNLTKDRFLIEPTAVPIKLVATTVSSATTVTNMATTNTVTPSVVQSTAAPIKSTKTDEIIVQGKDVEVSTIPDAKIEDNLIETHDSKPIIDAKMDATEVDVISVTNEPNQLIVDLNVQPPKHINTEKLPEIPAELIENVPTTEEPKATFAPELKNDRYVLLDKEALWGMLKEVVDDELRKSNSKLFDGERLRRQGYS